MPVYLVTAGSNCKRTDARAALLSAGSSRLFGTQIDVFKLTFDGLLKIFAIVMKKITGLWQILTCAPEKNREAFSRLAVRTVLNSAIPRL